MQQLYSRRYGLSPETFDDAFLKRIKYDEIQHFKSRFVDLELQSQLRKPVPDLVVQNNRKEPEI